MSDDTNRLDRRTILKGIGTTAAVGTGLAASTGGAAARTMAGVAAGYADESALRDALQAHGDGVVDQLRDAGIVDESFDLASLAFEVDRDVSGLEPSAADQLAAVSATVEDGTVTALGAVSTSSDTHEIALYVQPERGVAFARATPRDGGDTLRVSGDGVEPEGCEYTECVDDGDCTTSYCYTKKKYYSCDATCRNCSVYKTDCSCYVC